jgi:hypothetical protein
MVPPPALALRARGRGKGTRPVNAVYGGWERLTCMFPMGKYGTVPNVR